ncbi:MAG: hypothetical protein KF760_08855 [Candidatus Eremiobacteraeota bacterium]|nr:hypothetical protein [Candidatus Eremiobacteraeota bacterium]
MNQKLHSTGKQIADKADQALTQMGGVLQKAAGQLEAGSQYLNDSRVSDMQADLTNLIRKYPAQALLAGLSLGFLTGAVLSRR